MKYCIIIGTKKGATSSLYEYIRQHPRVVGGFKKEPNFFGNIKNWEKGMKWYHEQFIGHDPDQHVYFLDGTTDYTQEGYINIPRRMKETGKDFKFIYILRDPFQKMESQTHQFLIDRDSIRPIYECLDVRIVESCKYHKQLSRYLEHFPKGDFLLLDFNALRSDIDSVMSKVTDFLGLEEFEYDTSHIHNLKRSAVGQSYRGYRILRQLLRTLRITPLIPQVVKDKFRQLLGRYGGKKIKEEDYRLTQEQKRFLKKELMQDVKRLEEEFGFDTSSWELHSV